MTAEKRFIVMPQSNPAQDGLQHSLSGCENRVSQPTTISERFGFARDTERAPQQCITLPVCVIIEEFLSCFPFQIIRLDNLWTPLGQRYESKNTLTDFVPVNYECSD